jgi:phosphatidate cytidylyltransferase
MTRAPAAPALADAAPAVVALAGAVAVAHGAGFAAGLAWLVAALALAALIDVVRRRGAAGAWLMAGGVYIGLGCLAFLSLRAFEPFGFLTILWVILTVMAADVGGYFGGRLIGGAKLWPAVSPKKTWAGLLGGVGLAFLLGGLFSWATTGTYFEEVCTVSAIAALLAQGGDLAESAAKRHFGVKDAGTLIPGHGGALDRFDGLLAASLVAAAVTHWRGQTVFIW